jgi:hypothetical protein
LTLLNASLLSDLPITPFGFETKSRFYKTGKLDSPFQDLAKLGALIYIEYLTCVASVIDK